MKQILLTNSKKVAIVDDWNFDEINKYNWYLDRTKTGSKIRATTVINGRTNLNLSNFIWKFTTLTIDHKDRDVFNNLESNLRPANNSQNGANKVKWVKNASSQYKGVSFFKRDSNWRAIIKKDYKYIHIGYFRTEIGAAKAYDKKAKELFGEFAVLNFPEETL